MSPSLGAQSLARHSPQPCKPSTGPAHAVRSKTKSKQQSINQNAMRGCVKEAVKAVSTAVESPLILQSTDRGT